MRLYKPWKHGTKPTATSERNVDIGTRLFLDGEQFFHFWALAPTVQGVRRNTLVGTTEFVWLIEDETREVFHALVNKDSDEIHWKLPADWEAAHPGHIGSGYRMAAAAA